MPASQDGRPRRPPRETESAKLRERGRIYKIYGMIIEIVFKDGNENRRGDEKYFKFPRQNSISNFLLSASSAFHKEQPL